MLLVFHDELLFVIDKLGAVLSNLYVHTHPPVFHALSYAHRCKYIIDSAVFDVVAQFVYAVPLLQHCANVVLLLDVQ